ncbi:hypothetical protein PAMP_009634 [Pampus punctatissimus]
MDGTLCKVKAAGSLVQYAYSACQVSRQSAAEISLRRLCNEITISKLQNAEVTSGATLNSDATETFLLNEEPSRGPGMPECFVVSDSYRENVQSQSSLNNLFCTAEAAKNLDVHCDECQPGGNDLPMFQLLESFTLIKQTCLSLIGFV